MSLSVLAAPARAQSTDSDVATEIISSVNAQWAPRNLKNRAEATKNGADDYTEFNGDCATRLGGRR